MRSDGEEEQVFLPTGRDFISFVIIALIVVGLGFHRAQALGGLAIVGSAAVGAWWWKRLGRRRLVVGDRGLEVQTAFSSGRLSWKDAYYTYRCESLDDDFTLGDAVVDGLVISGVKAVARGIRRRPKRYATHLAVHGPGTSIEIEDYKDAKGAEARILSSIHERGAVDTSPFELRAGGLVHREELLRIVELDRVIVDDEFAVRKVGESSVWARCAFDAVHNPWLLINLLLERGVVIELCIDAPGSIRASIEAAIARQEGLPRAEVRSVPPGEGS